MQVWGCCARNVLACSLPQHLAPRLKRGLLCAKALTDSLEGFGLKGLCAGKLGLLLGRLACSRKAAQVVRVKTGRLRRLRLG